ncbi:MAG TPA: hypothetical protein VIM08_10620 [Arthrobacter sp.]
MSLSAGSTAGTNGVAAAAGSIDLTGLGYAVVGLFVLVWLLAVWAGRLPAAARTTDWPYPPGWSRTRAWAGSPSAAAWDG